MTRLGIKQDQYVMVRWVKTHRYFGIAPLGQFEPIIPITRITVQINYSACATIHYSLLTINYSLLLSL
jgi:hypothetical protein